MSYDIRIGVKVQDSNEYAVVAKPEYYEPTYNLAEMFRACTGWDFIANEWYRVIEIEQFLRHGVEELKNNPKKYKQYEDPSGGTIEDALEALQGALECIRDTETGRRGWNILPIDVLWLSW